MHKYVCGLCGKMSYVCGLCDLGVLRSGLKKESGYVGYRKKCNESESIVTRSATETRQQSMAGFAVLRVESVLRAHRSPGSEVPLPYDSTGLPPELVSRLMATYKSVIESRQRHKPDRTKSIEQWGIGEVPIYTMLNWIDASGWRLQHASVASVSGSPSYCPLLAEHYVFRKVASNENASESQMASHAGDKRKAE